MSMLKRLAVFLFLVGVACVPVQAQDWKGLGRIAGRVTDADGAPIQGAKVKLMLPERGGGTTVTTGKDGKWALGGIAAGNWQIDIEAEGYETKAIAVNLPGESVRLSPVVVPLEKAKPKGPGVEVVAALDTAEAAFKAGRFAEARAEFERLLGELPEHAITIHQRIGLCHLQEKNYPAALESLGKVLAAQPDNQQIRAIAAQAALEGGALDRGRELLATLDESTIQSADVFFNMGVNFLNANATDEAIKYFTLAIARDAAYVDGYYRRALAYLQLGKQQECRADFEKVIALAPDSPMGEMARKALESLK